MLSVSPQVLILLSPLRHPCIHKQPSIDVNIISSFGIWHSHHSAGLQWLSKLLLCGDKKFNLPDGIFAIQSDGSGGVIVDTGKSMTILQDEAYHALVSALEGHVTELSMTDAVGGREVCYRKPNNMSMDLDHVFPPLTLHLDGGDLLTHASNIFIDVGGPICLAILSSNQARTDISVVGNILQQNIHVGFDLKAMTLSLKPADCAHL